MTVTITLVEHPLVAVPIKGLRPHTPSSTDSLALARPTGDPHTKVIR